uniref:Interleukin family protein n=1 Tax=Mola mola TaxID=94237 RepID=A0A3Q3VWD8_MOLML
MSPWGFLLSVLLLLAYFCTTQSARSCSPCCSFMEGFPGRLRTLREKYLLIQTFYEANDDLEVELLDQSIQETFRSPFACDAMNSILDFYLRTVLPTALAGVTQNTKKLQPHVEDIQHIFYQLKTDVTRCRHHFSCKKPFDIHALNSTYTQMQSKGLFKAMNELGLLFNYFENFLASKWRGNHI